MDNYKIVNSIEKITKAAEAIRKLVIAVMLISTMVKCLKLLKS